MAIFLTNMAAQRWWNVGGDEHGIPTKLETCRKSFPEEVDDCSSSSRPLDDDVDLELVFFRRRYLMSSLLRRESS